MFELIRNKIQSVIQYFNSFPVVIIIQDRILRSSSSSSSSSLGHRVSVGHQPVDWLGSLAPRQDKLLCNDRLAQTVKSVLIKFLTIKCAKYKYEHWSGWGLSLLNPPPPSTIQCKFNAYLISYIFYYVSSNWFPCHVPVHVPMSDHHQCKSALWSLMKHPSSAAPPSHSHWSEWPIINNSSPHFNQSAPRNTYHHSP